MYCFPLLRSLGTLEMIYNRPPFPGSAAKNGLERQAWEFVAPLPHALALSWGAALGAQGWQLHPWSGLWRRASVLLLLLPLPCIPGDSKQPEHRRSCRHPGVRTGPWAYQNLSFPIRNLESDKEQAPRESGVPPTLSSSQQSTLQTIFPVQRTGYNLQGTQVRTLHWELVQDSQVDLEAKPRYQIPAPTLTSCVAIPKLLNLSELQSSHLFWEAVKWRMQMPGRMVGTLLVLGEWVLKGCWHLQWPDAVEVKPEGKEETDSLLGVANRCSSASLQIG